MVMQAHLITQFGTVCSVSSKLLESPRRTPGSRGSRGLRSAPRHQVLFVITGKYKGQSAKMHKTPQKKIQITANPTLTRRS